MQRSAFTLIELLVVIGIVGILTAILLPTVMYARDAARRVACRNNLKQIGIAFQAHHGVHGIFPTGGAEWWTPPTFVNGMAATGNNQEAGWAFQLLPFLEKGYLFDAAGKSDEEASVAAIGALHDVYFCPTRRAPQSLTYSDPYYLGGLTVTHALCDFAASNLEETGVVRPLVGVRMREIADGVSNTLIVAEKRMNIAILGTWQEDDNEGYTVGWDEDTVRLTNRQPAPDHRGDSDGDERFGASHPQGFHAVLADGSTHTISYEIDATSFANLGNISDGQGVNLGDY